MSAGTAPSGTAAGLGRAAAMIEVGRFDEAARLLSRDRRLGAGRGAGLVA